MTSNNHVWTREQIDLLQKHLSTLQEDNVQYGPDGHHHRHHNAHPAQEEAGSFWPESFYETLNNDTINQNKSWMISTAVQPLPPGLNIFDETVDPSGKKTCFAGDTLDMEPTPLHEFENPNFWNRPSLVSSHTKKSSTKQSALHNSTTDYSVTAPTSSSPSTEFSPKYKPILPVPAQSFDPENLPLTMVPPSVLTSMLPKSSMPSEISVETSEPPKKKRAVCRKIEAAVEVLKRLCEARGYGFTRISAEDAGYETTPSGLQLSSFGTEMVKAAHMDDIDRLDDLLSCGLSPNPCNQFRDSLTDLVCKRGKSDVFRSFLRHGMDVRVCDGFGRTPLHHCAWSNTFNSFIVNEILQRDIWQLFVEDKRGQTPLEYLRNDVALDWIDWMHDEMMDRFFPEGGTGLSPFKSPSLSRSEHMVVDPPGALPIPLAAALSSGRVSPEKVRNMTLEEKENYQ